jgi:hypothetical protein
MTDTYRPTETTLQADLDTLRLNYHSAVDQIAALQYRNSTLFPELRDENERLRRALHEIAEEWAGADGLLPPTPGGAYAVILAQRMARMAADALGKLQTERRNNETVD